MKTNFKNIGIAIASLATIIAPMAASAYGSEVKLSADIKENSSFCASLSDKSVKVDGDLNDRLTKIDNHHNDVTKDLAEKRSDRDSKLQETRMNQDQERQAQFAKLSATATTDAQKAAVVKFQADIQAAMDARKTAVTAAMTAFRAGVDALHSSKQSDVSAAGTAYKASVDAALAKAKTDCAAGVDAKTVRNTLQASLKVSHKTFIAARKANNVDVQMKALTQTRNTAFATALATFKAAALKARADLKVAFSVK